jgi:hypothetical protein
METFLGALGHLVLGVLQGFDRLVFRGHLRQLSYELGMECYLSANRVLLKDFKAHAIERTAELINASLAEAYRLNRPVSYLSSSKTSKEEEAHRIAVRDQIHEGLICVFKCVEPCWTFEVHRNRERKMLELKGKQGKCSFLYHYYMHPVFGFMHARVQTWFPYPVQVCLNGREWLARQMDRAGLSYQRRDNKFLDVGDFAKAQTLLDRQLRESWPRRLGEILHRIHPAHPVLLGRLPVDYYWSVYQSEWASDVIFRSGADVERLFPQWVRHAITTYRSTDVLRFLGRSVPLSGQVHKGFQGEVTSDLQRREEGLRVKHWVNGNSLKAYDFHGDDVAGNAVGGVRFETTINNPEEFKVYRTSEADPNGKMGWRILRKGIADLHRRAQVSQAANDRYAAAMASMHQTTPVKEVAGPLCQPAKAPGTKRPRKMRALNPLGADDGALLEVISDPKYAVAGLRNRDLVAALYSKPAANPKEQRRRSARATRLIRLLRAHGLLQKMPKSHLYQVSANARKTLAALLAARNANAEYLTTNAA